MILLIHIQINYAHHAMPRVALLSCMHGTCTCYIYTVYICTHILSRYKYIIYRTITHSAQKKERRKERICIRIVTLIPSYITTSMVWKIVTSFKNSLSCFKKLPTTTMAVLARETTVYLTKYKQHIASRRFAFPVSRG